MSSTNLSQRQGVGAVLRALTANSSMHRLAMRGLMGNPWLHHRPVHNTFLGRGSKVFLRQNSSKVTICWIDIWVICGSVGSCESLCCTQDVD